MHIPDGFLSVPVWAALDIAVPPAIGFVASRAHGELEEKRVPLLGVMGAFVFAAQMINFPVGVGTSGHLLGGALLAFTLGPAAAVMVLTAVITIQCLVFQDGGLLALGANVFNMAIAGVLAGYVPFHFWGSGPWRRAAVFFGAFLGVLTAACLALAELLLSGVPMPGAVIGLSFALFVVSASVEGGITLAVFTMLEKMNAGWIRTPQAQPSRLYGAIGGAAILLASVGALLASSLPDGLQQLAQTLGIGDRARTFFETPVSGYELQVASAPWVRKVSAGLIGLLLIYAACLGIGRVFSRTRSA